MNILAPDRTLPVDRVIAPDCSDKTNDIAQLKTYAVHSKQLLIDAEATKPLLLFVGGARDFYHNAVLQQLYIHYRRRYSEHYQIAYATHKAKRGIEQILKKWHDADQKLYLVGHSWGASRLMKVIHKQAKYIPIECLVTLDPVSRLTPGSCYTNPANVKLWINSYVDYSKVGLNIPNIVAIIGGHWLECPAADMNFVVSHYQQEEINHMSAWALFEKTRKYIPMLSQPLC